MRILSKKEMNGIIEFTSKLVEKIYKASQEYKFNPEPFVRLIKRDTCRLNQLIDDVSCSNYQIVIRKPEESTINYCTFWIVLKNKPNEIYKFHLSVLDDIAVTKTIHLDLFE